MSPEAQQAALVAAAGKCVYLGTVYHNERCTRCGEFIDDAKHRIPDYLNDLNAMHQLVQRFRFTDTGSTLWALNQRHLEAIVMRDRRIARGAVSFQWEVANATAAQRAEAFLRTIREWTGPETILDPAVWDENGNIRVKMEDLFK